MYGRTALSMSNGDADLSVGYCVSEGQPVGKYVDIGAMRTGCCTFPTFAFLSVVNQNVIAYLVAWKS